MLLLCTLYNIIVLVSVYTVQYHCPCCCVHCTISLSLLLCTLYIYNSIVLVSMYTVQYHCPCCCVHCTFTIALSLFLCTLYNIIVKVSGIKKYSFSNRLSTFSRIKKGLSCIFKNRTMLILPHHVFIGISNPSVFILSFF